MLKIKWQTTKIIPGRRPRWGTIRLSRSHEKLRRTGEETKSGFGTNIILERLNTLIWRNGRREGKMMPREFRYVSETEEEKSSNETFFCSGKEGIARTKSWEYSVWWIQRFRFWREGAADFSLWRHSSEQSHRLSCVCSGEPRIHPWQESKAVPARTDEETKEEEKIFETEHNQTWEQTGVLVAGPVPFYGNAASILHRHDRVYVLEDVRYCNKGDSCGYSHLPQLKGVTPPYQANTRRCKFYLRHNDICTYWNSKCSVKKLKRMTNSYCCEIYIRGNINGTQK